MTEPFKKAPNFFEAPAYKYGVPALLAVLLFGLYIYTVSDPILDETTALQAVPEKFPDPEAGKLLFLQHCSRCHGTEGEGSKEAIFKSAVTGRSYKAANLQDTEFVNSRSPVEFFSLVSNGTSDVMPAFKQRLSEQRTWDTVFYAFFLSKNREAIDKSEGSFRRACAKCHGEDGKKIAQLSDMKRYVKYSDDDLADSFVTDEGPVKNKAHLAEDLDRRAVLTATPFARIVPFLEN